MNATPLLNSVVAALTPVRLEAVLIGNAAAAIHGAPVTTLDFDFMVRAASVNAAKLKKFSRQPSVKKTKRHNERQATLGALRKESDPTLVELIRRRLALPIEKRMNFLRVRRPGGSSHL